MRLCPHAVGQWGHVPVVCVSSRNFASILNKFASVLRVSSRSFAYINSTQATFVASILTYFCVYHQQVNVYPHVVLRLSAACVIMVYRASSLHMALCVYPQHPLLHEDTCKHADRCKSACVLMHLVHLSQAQPLWWYEYLTPGWRLFPLILGSLGLGSLTRGLTSEFYLPWIIKHSLVWGLINSGWTQSKRVSI